MLLRLFTDLTPYQNHHGVKLVSLYQRHHLSFVRKDGGQMEMHPTKLASGPLTQRGSPHEMIGPFPSPSHPHFRSNIELSTQPSCPCAQPCPPHLSVIFARQLGISLQPDIVFGRQTKQLDLLGCCKSLRRLGVRKQSRSLCLLNPEGYLRL